MAEQHTESVEGDQQGTSVIPEQDGESVGAESNSRKEQHTAITSLVAEIAQHVLLAMQNPKSAKGEKLILPPSPP